jgi:hypothetical protein
VVRGDIGVPVDLVVVECVGFAVTLNQPVE